MMNIYAHLHLSTQIRTASVFRGEYRTGADGAIGHERPARSSAGTAPGRPGETYFRQANNLPGHVQFSMSAVGKETGYGATDTQVGAAVGGEGAAPLPMTRLRQPVDRWRTAWLRSAAAGIAGAPRAFFMNSARGAPASDLPETALQQRPDHLHRRSGDGAAKQALQEPGRLLYRQTPFASDAKQTERARAYPEALQPPSSGTAGTASPFVFHDPRREFEALKQTVDTILESRAAETKHAALPEKAEAPLGPQTLREMGDRVYELVMKRWQKELERRGVFHE